MDTTVHTTNAVEFIDYRAKALEKLNAEEKGFKGAYKESGIYHFVAKNLRSFCEQDAKFAEVVFKTKRTLSECCAEIVEGSKSVLSDFDAYSKAVKFYFPNAQVEFQMNVRIVGDAPSEAEMNKPATVPVKPGQNNLPKPLTNKAASAPSVPDVKPAAAPKKTKAEPKKDDPFMQLSLWGE